MISKDDTGRKRAKLIIQELMTLVMKVRAQRQVLTTLEMIEGVMKIVLTSDRT